MTAVARAPETLAVLTLLRTQLTVGDGTRPTGWASAAGYAVLYPLGVPADGPVADAYADTQSEYQITAVGETRAQAQILADHARVLMLTGSLSIPGRALMQPVEWSESRGVDRDDDTSPPLFYAIDRYVIRTTPS
jgi:hypothetical protein